MKSCLIAWLAVLLQAAETKNFRATISTTDGSFFTGTIQLPAKLTVKTKFGDLVAETSTRQMIRRQGDVWALDGSDGTTLGELDLGTVTLVTSSGKLGIPQADISAITLLGLAGPVPAPPPSPAAAPLAAEKRVSACKAYPVRSGYKEDYSLRRWMADVALLLSDGKHLALLDGDALECVFLELATGKVTRVRVDAGACHLIERNGKVYVANSQARSITVISASSLQTLRQVAVKGEPYWLTAPAAGPLLYIAAARAKEPGLQCLNTQTDTIADPVTVSGYDVTLGSNLVFAEVTPDNRRMVVMSGSSYASIFDLERHGIGNPKNHSDPFRTGFSADFKADRAYFGPVVFSADLDRRIATLADCDLLAPHPSKRLLFGRQYTAPPRSESGPNRTTRILVLDEESFDVLKTIDVGGRVCALVPAEEALYVVSETKVYEVDLKKEIDETALSRPKPERRKEDAGKIAAAGTTTKKDTHILPRLGGWALLGDHRTLVASLTEKAELLVFDTTEGAELRRVTLDFQPGAIAVQGDTLYIVRSASSMLYAVDATSGRVKKEIRIPGDPLVRVACASKGRVYASNARGNILSIDPADGAAVTTAARGLFLQVDPSGLYVYAGRTSPRDWGAEAEKEADGTVTWYYDDLGYRSMIRKYVVSGTTLRQVAINDNTAVNGCSMVLSPDGLKISTVGRGGWHPKRAGGGAGGATIAVYDTKDLSTMLGQVEVGWSPQAIAFHPVLDIGATLKDDSGPWLALFRTKSMVHLKQWKLMGAPRGLNESGWIMFADRGEKLLLWQMGGWDSDAKQGKLYLFPLELKDEEKAALRKAYGTSAPASDPARLFREAEEAERRGDNAAALRLYRQGIAEDPSSEHSAKARRRILALEEGTAAGGAAGLLRTARTHDENGESKDALRYYKRIVSEHPNSPEAAEARKKIGEIEKK